MSDTSDLLTACEEFVFLCSSYHRHPKEEYLNRISACVRRVTEAEAYNAALKSLGLPTSGRGQGAVILLVGPPGTGKTKTAELFAAELNKPIIRVPAFSMAQPEALHKELSGEFKRATTMGAVLLLDDAGALIKKRGEHPILDEVTSVLLRSLDDYNGIVFITSNHMDKIDQAVFSRCHLVLSYDRLERDVRRKLWVAMLSGKLAESLIGDEERRERLYEELSGLELDGREVETAITNAVRRSIWENNGKVPAGMAKWIQTRVIFEEAQNIAQSKQQM